MKITLIGQMLNHSNIFAVVFLPCKPYMLFPWFEIFTKIRFSNVYIFEYEHLKHFLFERMIIFSPISRRLEIGHIFGTGGYKCLLWMCSGRKTNPSTYIFGGNSNSYYINILFKSRNITIKAHLAMSVGLP